MFEVYKYLSEIYVKFILVMQNTIKQYDYVINQCSELFSKKMKDYGSAWRILRLSSLTDQIFIKAQRIRGLQQNNTRKVDEGQYSEFILIKSLLTNLYSLKLFSTVNIFWTSKLYLICSNYFL